MMYDIAHSAPPINDEPILSDDSAVDVQGIERGRVPTMKQIAEKAAIKRLMRNDQK